MLPFRRTDRVVALDDTDIVESRDLEVELDVELDVEVELDLGDAVEVHPATRRSVLPPARTPSRTPARTPSRTPSGTPSGAHYPARAHRSSGALELPAFLQPRTQLYQFSELSPGAVRPAHLVTQDDLDDDEEEELTELKPPSRRSWNPRPTSISQITPSPFARSFVARELASELARELPESIAPVAVSNFPDSYRVTRSREPRLRLERVEREESALEERELREITSTRSTKVLRGLALMMMGGVAAAAITAYALRNDVPVADLETAPLPPMASISVPKDAVLIGNTPPPQLETRLGAQPPQTPPGEVVQAPVQMPTPAASSTSATSSPPPTALAPTFVKFGDGDALVVPRPAPQASQAASTTPSGSEPARPRKARKPSQPLPANALLPDSDSPPSYSLPPSRGGAPKDPVAEAQLRASMR